MTEVFKSFVTRSAKLEMAFAFEAIAEYYTSPIRPPATLPEHKYQQPYKLIEPSHAQGHLEQDTDSKLKRNLPKNMVGSEGEQYNRTATSESNMRKT